MAFTEAIAADGQSDEFRATGKFQVHLIGTFGTGTVTIEQKINNTFETLQGTDKTAAADFIVDALSGGIYRFDLAGSSGAAIVLNVLGDVEATRVVV